MREQDVMLAPDDAKLVTLARSSRARQRTATGAAVRDTDGRTYAGADVTLPSLGLTALQVAVAMAASSGAPGLEAAVVVSGEESQHVNTAIVADLGGPGIPVYVARADGTLVRTVTT